MGVYGFPIIDKLFQVAYPETIITHDETKEPDLIIRSFFNEPKRERHDVPYIFFSGESNRPFLRPTDPVAIIGTALFDDIDVIWAPYFMDNLADTLFDRPKHVKKYTIGYCASRTVSVRESFFQAALWRLGSDQAHAIGRCSRNKIMPELVSAWNRLPEFITPYKFFMSMENTIANGYVTEKITNAYRAGCVPIYWGASQADDIFNKDSFVNIQDFESPECCVEYIADCTDEAISETISQNPFREQVEWSNYYFSRYDSDLPTIVVDAVRKIRANATLNAIML